MRYSNMATRLPKLSRYIPLWKRSIPKYPLYWKGDPQLRVYTPLFWMKLVKPKEAVPANQVRFEVHPQMTVYDVENYLEKIYNVNVLSVNTFLLRREEKFTALGFTLRKENPRRIAVVLLPENETFEFPKIFHERKTEDEKLAEDYKKVAKEITAKNQKAWDKLDIPIWYR